MILALAGGAIGIAIGSTGIGGVLLVPFLTYALGLPVQAAIALALWSYLWSGLLAVWLYARRGSIAWRMASLPCLAALPGAFLGARAVMLVPGAALQALIALLLVAAGINALLPPRARAGAARPLGGGALLLLGAITGFGSALLGAGGAVILVPLLVALDEPVLLAVGLGQAIQVPIAATASLANLAEGRIDLVLGSVLALALGLGIALGTPLAHALPQHALRRLLALVMLAAGMGIALRLAFNAA